MKTIFTLLFIITLSVSAYSQEPKKPEGQTKPDAKTVKKYSAKDYDDLLVKLKSGDTNIDYTALRMAFTETKDYSYHGPEKTEREKFFQPFNDKKYKDALKQAEKFLEKNYLDANAHFVAYNSAKELKDEKKAEFHKAVLLGLSNSIKNGNDGLSAKAPFSVITIDEEYTLMRFLGYKLSSQSLQNSDGHTFDVMTATDPKTNAQVKLYFNIDVVWAAETKLFGN